MKYLTQILAEASIRQGLPHIKDMTHEQIHHLIDSGKIDTSDATEKTDGASMKFGHDANGFWSQSTGSGADRMRHSEDYINRAKENAKARGLSDVDLAGPKAFAEVHGAMHKNIALQKHLHEVAKKQGGETEVRGEIFAKKLSRPSHINGEVKFVGTSYNPNHMGSVGKFVIHSKLPENAKHDIEHFKSHLSDDKVNFDDDKIHGLKPASLDVTSEKSALNKVNHELMKTRLTSKNRAEVEGERAKFQALKNTISDKMDKHIESLNIKPKWGSESEGTVIHPPKGSTQPRFKVTSQNFRAFKADPANKRHNPREKIVESFKQFILEGGNVKVKSSTGEEVAADPIDSSKREEYAKDLHDSLSQIHDSFKKEHGGDLFGANKKALTTGSAFSGSTRHFMSSKIPTSEFVKYKPTTGDFDVQIDKQHKDAIGKHLTPGKSFGKYSIVGTKKHGTQTSAIIKHASGVHHQLDFEPVEYEHDEPTKGEQFTNSSDWEDTKSGFKGLHRQRLMHSAGLDKFKFTASHGLRPKGEDKLMGIKDPTEVSKILFGPKADHSKIKSFRGVSELVRDHMPDKKQEVYDRFKQNLSNTKGIDNSKAIKHLKDVLGTKDTDTVTEETKEQEQHVSAIPLVGFSPISHMGHAIDLGGTMKKIPGEKFVGVSNKSDFIGPEERKHIMEKQWGDVGAKINFANKPDETLKNAYDSVKNKTGKKILHIVVGKDRESFGNNLKKSIENRKVPGAEFDEVHVHMPDDENRTHGLSGTKMRQAALDGNTAEFHRHMGAMFSDKESNAMMNRIKSGIQSNKLTVKR